MIYRGKTGAAYITFDDGPDSKNTDNILQVLAGYNVRATFFMVGEYMEKHPRVVEAVIEAGHTIGYHSFHHKSLRKTGLKELREDMKQARKLSERFGYSLKLYRPPFGELTVAAAITLLVHGWKIVMWSRDSRDSFDSFDQVVANLDPENIADGDIILMHDDFPSAAELLETVIGRMRSGRLRLEPLQSKQPERGNDRQKFINAIGPVISCIVFFFTNRGPQPANQYHDSDRPDVSIAYADWIIPVFTWL